MYRIGQEEVDAVSRVLLSGSLFRIDSKYKEVEQFEMELKEKMGTEHALCLSSGTASLITSLAALGVGPGDEVLIPAYTFIATASAVLAVGAIPVLCDINETLTIDTIDAERKISKHTKAIIPVHIQGFPSDMDAVMALAKKHNLYVVEDACQADGGSFKGRRLGSMGDFGTYSFNWFKIISAGEGGALVTNNMKLYERAIVYHDCGSNFWPYSQEISVPAFSGINYRVSEVIGAIMRVQLKRLDGILTDLRNAKKAVMHGCSDIPGISFAPSNDIEGDCAINLSIQFKDVGTAVKFAEAAKATRPINTGKHVYSNWPSVMEKLGGHSDTANPYAHPANKPLNMSFGPDSCPNTVDILSRTVYIGVPCEWNDERIAGIIERIRNAAKTL